MDFSSIVRCTQLGEHHIVAALESSDAMQGLLARFEEIATPGTGGHFILLALARLASPECDWLEGDLRIEVSGDATRTKIVVTETIGGGFREKLFRDTHLRVPFDEFSSALSRGPRLVEPLALKESGRRIVLGIASEQRRTTFPPPPVAIDPTSIERPLTATAPYVGPRPDMLDDAPPSSSFGAAAIKGPRPTMLGLQDAIVRPRSTREAGIPSLGDGVQSSRATRPAPPMLGAGAGAGPSIPRPPATGVTASAERQAARPTTPAGPMPNPNTAVTTPNMPRVVVPRPAAVPRAVVVPRPTTAATSTAVRPLGSTTSAPHRPGDEPRIVLRKRVRDGSESGGGSSSSGSGS